MRNLSLQRGDAFILVYDVTNAETFEEVRRIRDDIHKVRQTNTVPIVVVGNKIDLADTETREVCLLLLTHFDAHIFFAELASLSHILSLWLYFYLFVCPFIPLHKFLFFFVYSQSRFFSRFLTLYLFHYLDNIFAVLLLLAFYVLSSQ